MFFYILSFVLCDLESKVNIHEFYQAQYNSFRENITKNSFLISLGIKDMRDFDFYNEFFNDICNDISSYINEDINLSYSILINPDLNIKYNSTFIIYLPGISEAEADVYPRMSVAYNANKILKKCLEQAINLRRIEKAQKSPEIARIKGELRAIAAALRNHPSNYPKREQLLKDYDVLTDELMQYISEDKQKEKKLKLQLQIQKPGSSEAKKIEKLIEKHRKNAKKYETAKKDVDLSPKQLEKIAEKKMINSLRVAIRESGIGVIKSIFSASYRHAKSGIIYLWKSFKNKKKVDDL